MERKTSRIFGIPFLNASMDGAAELAFALAEEAPVTVVTPNVEILYGMRKDPALREALEKADVVLPDGIGVVLAGRILGTPVERKLAGVEFGETVLRRAAEEGKSVYFLGAKPGVAEKAAGAMREKYPGLKVAGTADGYFRDDGAAAAAIRESGAYLALICLGSPKQEIFMERFRNETGCRLHAALGGSMDVYAGCAKRAPRWMIRLGLEWLYRLVREPKRLGRMLRIPGVLFAALRIRLFGEGKKDRG
ncbi:MAG: WecB/TagA/CpsF family glycosyltransferase [Clostridia bacterium]|nr:WecB/TagA/CpsF family glycosyltransferase [Clostridia bacterium]